MTPSTTPRTTASVAVGPGDRGGAHVAAGPVGRRRRRRAPAAPAGSSRPPRSSGPSGCPGTPPRASISMPESSATATSPVASRTARALGGRWPRTCRRSPRRRGRGRRRPSRRRGSPAISSTLWALPVASRSRRVTGERRRRVGHHLPLELHDLGDAAFGEGEQRVELAAGERPALGRALHLDEPPRPGHHHVHVDLGAGVLDVGQVEHGHAADDPDGDGGARLDDRVARRCARRRPGGCRRRAAPPSRRRSTRCACRRRPAARRSRRGSGARRGRPCRPRRAATGR